MYRLNYHSLLHELELQKVSIQNQFNCGILDSIDATSELMMITKKETKIKETLVMQYHISKDGTPRTISYLENRNLYTTFMPNRSRISAKTKEALIDKLMEYYNLTINDTSFKTVFELALDEKQRTENPDSKTIEHYKSTFKRFIDVSLANKDIRKISSTDLQEYTQKLVNSPNPPSEKAFLKYKGILNLAFDYSISKGIIVSNPVIHIKNSVYKKSCAITDNSPENKIHSPQEIELIKSTVRKRMTYKTYNHGYFINGFAILFSIETGVRCGELCSLKWADVKEDYIHIHSQQLKKKAEKGKKGSTYYYAHHTKNEKGISRDGRKFPLTQAIKSLLEELKVLQDELNIQSEYIFCHEDGEWIKTDAYETCLRRLCQSLGMNVTNNHAFRMSLNSNVFIPLGLPVTERARLLGHSVETNHKYYSFAGKNNLQDICDLLNGIA